MYRPNNSEYYIHVTTKLKYGWYFHRDSYNLLRPAFRKQYHEFLVVL